MSSSAHVAAAADGVAGPYDAASAKADGLDLYKVRVERGSRRTESGAMREYTLYCPEPSSNLPAGPYPLLELVHGFLMTGEQHSHNAKALAERGFVVITPNITKVLLGDAVRMRCVDDVLDFVSWLIKESKDKNSPHYHLIDPDRIAIGGNSSGGAVCLEAVIQAQKKGVPVKAMVSLEGVPWDRTKSEVASLKPLRIITLRIKPALCNYHSKVLEFMKLLKFKTDDVLIVGAHHCDAENPTTFRCKCVCGPSDPVHRALFERIMYLYLRDVMNVRLSGEPSKTFADAVKDMEKQGKVVARLDQWQK
jgi:hypothetical protein